MRAPAALGFYPADKNELSDTIKKMLSKAKESKGKILGAIVPHAGYVYSGQTAAYVYRNLQSFDTIVILGPNHSGVGEDFALSLEDWETPLGEIKNDVDFGRKLLNNCKMIKVDELAHMYEHSIEVQLPFLQSVMKDFKIVPICISSRLASLENCEILGESITRTATLNKKNILIIASSDMTHFGESYGFAPVSKDQVEWIKKTDKEVIDAILKFDAENAFKLATKTTVCGYAPIITLLYALKGKAKSAKLLNYSTSCDISKSTDMIVGYAAIAFG